MNAIFSSLLAALFWSVAAQAQSLPAFAPAGHAPLVQTLSVVDIPASEPRVVAAPHVAAAAAHAPALDVTPAQAASVLEMLGDPQKRAAFTATLQTIVKAAAPQVAKPAVPLAPGSLGEQVLSRSAGWVDGLSAQLAAFGHVLGNLPAVWSFTSRTLNNPDTRDRVFQGGWRLILVLGVAAAAAFGAERVLRRPMRALARQAPGFSPAEAAEEAEAEKAEAVPTATVPRHRFSRAFRALRRLPYVILRLILDLVPLGLFLAIGYAGMVFSDPQRQPILLIAITAFGIYGAATCLARAVTSPDAPHLRLVALNDQGASYLVVWVRRLVGVGAAGYAATQLGLIFGLPSLAAEAFVKTVSLLLHLMLVIMVLQCRAPVAARIRPRKTSSKWGRTIGNRLADTWHLIAIFFIAGSWLVWAAELRDGYARIWHVFLVTAAVLIAARIVGILILGSLDHVFRVSPTLSARYPGLETRANRYYPMLRQAISVILFVITGLALLQSWGVNTLSWFSARALGGQLVGTLATIAAAALVAVAIWEAVNIGTERHLQRLTRQAQIAKTARLRTLLPILRTVLLLVLVTIFGLTVLSQIGVNIAPLLAGAGILGVAIGFGSQKLVQDFITGIFLLLENAMQVGDWVTVAGLSGSVENLSIRTMRLRAGDGSVHIIPFSSVSTVTNVNRGVGNAAVSVSVPMDEDTDHICEILSEIARDMRGEAKFADMMRSDLQLWGVDKLEGGAVTIVGQIVCTDAGRWAVQREFNRRLNLRFKEQGIRVATPMQTVYTHVVGHAPKPVAVASDDPPADQVRLSPPPQALGNTS